jgi:repressor LexA
MDRLGGDRTAPSIREICEYMGYRSTRAAHDVVAALIRKGYLIRELGCARGLRLSPGVFDALGLAKPQNASPPASIPVRGSIVAGAPTSAVESDEGVVPISPEFFGIPNRHRAFALRVRGDSMIGRHFLPGDLVVCDADAEARDGDAVAALIDGESTLKTLVLKSGSPWLRAENPAYPEIYPADELTIQGVACGVIRPQAA